MESRPTIIYPQVESSDSEQKLADSNNNSNDDPLRIGMWAWAIRVFNNIATRRTHIADGFEFSSFKV